jgi:hypothetical protein
MLEDRLLPSCRISACGAHQCGSSTGALPHECAAVGLLLHSSFEPKALCSHCEPEPLSSLLLLTHGSLERSSSSVAMATKASNRRVFQAQKRRATSGMEPRLPSSASKGVQRAGLAASNDELMTSGPPWTSFP